MSKDEDTITRKDLLQINAILMTGILIFLSVYGDIYVVDNDLLSSIFFFIFSLIFFTGSAIITLLSRENTIWFRSTTAFLLAGLVAIILAVILLLSSLYGIIIKIITYFAMFLIFPFIPIIILIIQIIRLLSKRRDK